MEETDEPVSPVVAPTVDVDEPDAAVVDSPAPVTEPSMPATGTDADVDVVDDNTSGRPGRDDRSAGGRGSGPRRREHSGRRSEAGNALKRGAEKTESALEQGAAKTRSAIEEGANKLKEAIDPGEATGDKPADDTPE